MEFKKKTIIWEDNNEPPKNYIWVKSDGDAYEFNHTTRQWEKIMSSNGSGSGEGGSGEKIAFEDWKRNPYAFPMVNMIDFAKNGQDVTFSISYINPKFFGNLGGFVLGVSNDYIRDSNLTVNEFFNINDENFVLVADDDSYVPDLILSNNDWIYTRENQFNINSGESFNAFYTKHDLYKLPIVSNNSIEYGLIKIVSKDNPNFIFYTTYKNTFGGHD